MFSKNEEVNEYLKELNVKEFQNYYRCDCPECGTKQSAFIYKNNPEWLRCNRLNNCNFIQKIGDFDAKDIKQNQTPQRTISSKGTTMLHTALKLFSNQNREANTYSKELLERGISAEILSQYNIAEFQMNVKELVEKIPTLKESFHSSHFSDFYNGYKILIPIYDEKGESLDWILFRSMDESAKPKEISFKLHPYSNDILNVHELLNEKQTVVITEGVFDGLSFAEVTDDAQMISLIGCKKYKRLLKYIDKHLEDIQHKKIIVAFDNDTAGNEYGDALVKELRDRGINAKRFEMSKYTDVNEYFCSDREQFLNEIIKEGISLKPDLKNYHNRITLNRFEQGNLLATAKIQINGITISDIRIMNGVNGPFMSFYQYKDKKGKYQDVIKIIDKDIYKEFNSKVINSYNEMIKQDKSLHETRFDFEDYSDYSPEVINLKHVNYGNKIRAIGNAKIGPFMIKGLKVVEGDNGFAVKLPAKTIANKSSKIYYKNIILVEPKIFSALVENGIKKFAELSNIENSCYR